MPEKSNKCTNNLNVLHMRHATHLQTFEMIVSYPHTYWLWLIRSPTHLLALEISVIHIPTDLGLSSHLETLEITVSYLNTNWPCFIKSPRNLEDNCQLSTHLLFHSPSYSIVFKTNTIWSFKGVQSQELPGVKG